MKVLSIISLFFFSNLSGQGIYAPGVGMPGTTAIHKDSSVFVSWGTQCQITRGYQQIDSTQLGFATHGDSSHATGKADGQTVSLGDRGTAIYQLSQPIFDGLGADFAVFENGFSSNFLELAFVSVSSDGVNYFTFPSFSTTQDTSQIDAFGAIDATNIHNLAGKYQVNYGTPFNLDEITNHALLNKSNITHIKITDVVGTIRPEFASHDSQNNPINDPWPTPFASSGFDLDALGLIHVNGINSLEEKNQTISIFPNPFSDKLTIQMEEEIVSIQLVSISGAEITFGTNKVLDLSSLSKGVYVLKIKTNTHFYVKKVVKK